MLEELKRRVWQANLDLAASGLVTLTWGNASGISDDRRTVAIKPSGVAYSAMQPEDMVLVALADGQVVDGRCRPSSDTRAHLELYRAWPHVGGVAHTHSPHATAFAQAARAIPCLGTTHADHFRGDVPVARSPAPHEVADDYEAATGRVIVERFAEGLDSAAVPGVLVAGHGPFTWGDSAEQAVENAVALEAVALSALMTLALDASAPPLAEYLVAKHHDRKHGPAAYYGQRRDG